MDSSIQVAKPSTSRSWLGRVMSALAVLFMLFDCIIHLARIAPVVQSFAHLGYPIEYAVPIGIIELCCLVLYAVPRTSVLGAILLTGYLGGAVAIQLRISAPLFSTALFPLYLGVLLWGGLYLRDERVSTLLSPTQ